MRVTFAFLFFLLFSVYPLFAIEKKVVTPKMSTEDIQRIIDNAKANDILIFSKGTYNLSKSLSIAKAISIEGETTNPSDVVLQTSQRFRHISATAGKIHIQNICFTGVSGNSGGGIEHLGQDSLIIYNCEFLQNGNVNGGAIYVFGNLQVEKSLFSYNAATGNGGAVYSRGKSSFSGCYFFENQAPQGGAVFNQVRSRTRIEAVELNNCVFFKNRARQGGGIYSENPIDAADCDFIENKAESTSGGGVFSLNAVTVSRSSFYRNESRGKGGGIFSQRFVSVSKSYFVQNRSEDFGGGIFSKPEMENNTGEINLIISSIFSENEARGGGGSFLGLPSIVRDTYYEKNNSHTAGGGIFSEKDLLLDRTCFESNIASTEGGAVDAFSIKMINTSMVGNMSQNASAVHAQNEAVIIFSSFSGNRSSLKTGGVVYGANVSLYGNIISGNNDQDKVTGKIRTNEYNLIKNNPVDIFRETNSNGQGLLSKNQGSLPVLFIRNGGSAYKKIPHGQLNKWERELGIIDFFKKDQLGNDRNLFSSVDIGAVVYESKPISNLLPIIDISRLLATVNNPKIQIQKERPAAIPPVTAYTTQQPSSSTTSRQPVEPTHATSTTSSGSFEDDLDRIIDAILGSQTLASTSTSETSRENNSASRSQQNQNQSENTLPKRNTNDISGTEKGSGVSSRPTTIPVIPTSNPLSSNGPLEGAYTVNSKLPFGGRNFSSLEEAINVLNSKGNTNTIQLLLSPGVYIVDRPLTISNASFPIHIIKNSNESGDVCIRSRGNNRVIVVAVNAPLKINGIIFEGPEVDSQGRNVKNGGGISCNTNAVLTFENCIFRYNKGQMGGCIFARNVFIFRCAFYDNISSDGGAIYATECTAVNSTFYRNKAAVGGGIYAKDRAVVVFCTFTQNEANGRASAIFSPNLNLYGSIVTGNKGKEDFDGALQANFSNVLENIKPFNVFADITEKEEVKLYFSGGNPIIMIKPGSVATEQISESLLLQWEDELGLNGLLTVDQEGKQRPQNRNAEIGAWEIPDKRGH